MGGGILERVLKKLTEAGFAANYSFPGHARAMADGTAVAVHLAQVDNANASVTVEVSVISPSVLGGTRCEKEALRVMAALHADGAACIQNGCEFNGMAETYVVQIMAQYRGTVDGDTFYPRPGFTVKLNSKSIPFLVSFEAEQVRGDTPQYVMGQTEPVDVSLGSWVWNLRMEEMIPAGEVEDSDTGDPLFIKVVGSVQTEVYNGCRWTSVQRIITREGLRKIRKGIALEREVETVG